MQSMENFLIQCSNILPTEMPLLISVMLAGFIGSLTHCSVMCAPLTAAQMLTLHERKMPQNTIYYYHAGRISTYMLLGMAAVMVSHWIFSGALHLYTDTLLIVAGITFIISAVSPRKAHRCCSSKAQTTARLIHRLPFISLAYYLRGMLMGFMPCGMIVAVLLSVATLNHPINAAFVMLIFGITTVPILQLSGYGVLSLHQYYPTLSVKTGRSVMALNGLFLCGLGLNLVSVH